MDVKDKQQLYERTIGHIRALIADETDSIAIMATVVCELHQGFDTFDWTGFYRVVAPGLLKVGPYQGAHGCLEIPFERGVCGAAARSRQTQVVPDVQAFAGHIACSATTRAEIVIPVLDAAGELIAVLDVDSNQPDAFDETDRINLEAVCRMVGLAVDCVDG